MHFLCILLTVFFFQHWVDNANLKELISLDVDASDNLTEEALFNFINVYGPQLKGTFMFLFSKKNDQIKMQ